MLTFGELFAGIGGFSLGLERAGMTCKWQVEIDPYATAVLRKHWPKVPKHDDVRTFPPQGEYAVDVICGGFPCQDISVAGRGAGLAGARSGLWYEYARIIGELRPRYVIVENVAALLARGMGTVLGDLSTLGYDAEWHVIPASAVGAPHRRERVWIVGVRSRLGAEAHAPRSHADRVGSHRAEVNVVGGVELRDGQDGFAGSLGEDVPGAIGLGYAVRGDGSAGKAAMAGRRLHAGGSQRNRGTRCAGQAGQGACDVADAECVGRSTKSDRMQHGEASTDRKADFTGGCCEVSADADRARRQQQRRPESVRAEQLAAECGGWWSVEPDVGRVAHGVPARVDRLRCLGNAVVPQVVEIIGRAIVEHAMNEEARWNRDSMDARRR